MWRWNALAFVATLVLAVAFPASAQKPSRQFLVVEEEVIDPSKSATYEQGISTAVAAMRAASLGPSVAWEASQYQDSYFFVFRVSSLDDIDPESPAMRERTAQLARAMDEASYARFTSMTEPAIRGNTLSVLEPIADLSYAPHAPVVKTPKFAYVDVHRVKPGRDAEYRAVIGRFVEALRKAGYPIGFTAYRVVIGEGKTFFGEGRTYYFVAPFETHSQFYDEHSFDAALVKTLGADGTKQLFADEMRCLDSFESREYRLRPDLSYRTAATGPAPKEEK